MPDNNTINRKWIRSTYEVTVPAYVHNALTTWIKKNFNDMEERIPEGVSDLVITGSCRVMYTVHNPVGASEAHEAVNHFLDEVVKEES